jgi:hypothetical protein
MSALLPAISSDGKAPVAFEQRTAGVAQQQLVVVARAAAPAHGHSIRRRLGWRSRIHLLTQIDRSQQSAAMQQGSDPHTARVRSVSESTAGACDRMRRVTARGESSPQAAPQLGKVQSQEGR